MLILNMNPGLTVNSILVNSIWAGHAGMQPLRESQTDARLELRVLSVLCVLQFLKLCPVQICSQRRTLAGAGIQILAALETETRTILLANDLHRQSQKDLLLQNILQQESVSPLSVPVFATRPPVIALICQALIALANRFTACLAG